MLYAHQKDGAAFLRGRSSGYLGHDPGLGKTRTTLEATTGECLLVVCPAIVRNVWRMEAALYGRSVQVITGRAGGVDSAASLVVLSWDLLHLWQQRLIPFLQAGATLVLDEVHLARSPKTRRHKAAANLSVFASRKVALSGTPMVNGAMDLYYQLRLLGSEHDPFFWTSASAFGERFCNPSYNPFSKHMEYRGLKDEAGLTLALSGVMDRKLKRDCLDLPEKLRLPLFLERQASLGIPPGKDLFGALAEARSALSPKKARLTIDYIEGQLEAVRPLVVVGWHRSFLKTVSEHFKAPTIDGSTSTAERTRLIAEFQAGRVPILCVQMIAAGTGITLTASSHMIFGELSWSAVDLAQCEDRVHRIGTTTGPTYHYLMCENSCDDLMWNVCLRKGADIDSLDKATMDMRELQLAIGT